jgi:hexosaminidase
VATLTPRHHGNQTASSMATEDRAALTLMPLPAKLSLEAGELIIDSSFTVALIGYVEPRLEGAAQRLVERLATQTGIPMPRGFTAAPGEATLTLHCASAAGEIQALAEDESYALEVAPSGAVIRAAKPYGVLRGIETFLQLVGVGESGFAAPAVRIEDAPRFPWRGLMLDVCRHWIPLEVIKRNLDGMAAVKLNVLHLHLTEDQGFRIESKRFPKLHELGSDGGYFTQEQIREIIAYARERGIRVVPEFDVPGHTSAWFVGYPALASAAGPYQIERTFGVKDPTIDPTREEVYQFLDQLFDEMVTLFPDDYFHIGGDEVNGVHWDENPRIQEFIAEHDLEDNRGLQAYFNRRVQAMLAEKGKTMVGWDEVLHPDMPQEIIVHSWRGQASLAEAAAQGYQGILSHGYYLDHNQPAAFHYGFDPLPTALEGLIDVSGPWYTWHIEMSAPFGKVKGHLTVCDVVENLRGVIALQEMNLWAALQDVYMGPTTLSFRFSSGFGIVAAALEREGDRVTGGFQFAGMELGVQGTRAAGSDMPVTAPPVIEGARKLTPEEESRILGGEACMWAELVNPETIDGRIWPRLAAIAERLWSPAELTQDEQDMYRRLTVTSDWLSWAGIRHQSNYASMLRRMTTGELKPLKRFAEVVEPIKFYQRIASREYSQFTPLNRLVDAVPAESAKARAFERMVDDLLADAEHQAQHKSVEDWLTLWRDNHAQLRPTLEASFLLQPLQSLSQNLSDVAALGLEALKALDSGTVLAATQVQEGLALLDRAASPQDELLLAIVPAARKLLGAALTA